MLTRDQSVNLQRGQQVRVTTFLAKNVIGRIASVIVPSRGERVLEVDNLTADGKPWVTDVIWVGATQLETL